MLEKIQLDNLKDAARAALESYLDRLTLPTLQGFDAAQPLELTLHASLRTSGPLPPQTLALTITALKVRTETNLITTGAAPLVETPLRRLEEFFDSADLPHLDDILRS